MAASAAVAKSKVLLGHQKWSGQRQAPRQTLGPRYLEQTCTAWAAAAWAAAAAWRKDGGAAGEQSAVEGVTTCAWVTTTAAAGRAGRAGRPAAARNPWPTPAWTRPQRPSGLGRLSGSPVAETTARKKGREKGEIKICPENSEGFGRPKNSVRFRQLTKKSERAGNVLRDKVGPPGNVRLTGIDPVFPPPVGTLPN